MMKNALVILAGGKGKRFGQKIPKQFLKIGNTNFLNYLFLIILSVAIVASLQTVGIILVLSMLLIPAAASKQIIDTFVPSIYVSIIFGVFSSVSGLFLSYFFNLPSGPSMSLVATSIFVICFFISKLKEVRV